MATENQVKSFMAEYVQRGSNAVGGIWGRCTPEGEAALALAIDKANWQVEESFGPGNEMADYWNDSYDVYTNPENFSADGPHYTLPSGKINMEDVNCVYVVSLTEEPFDEFVRFLVIEDTENKLILSWYIGD